jgi:hypothetical protein
MSKQIQSGDEQNLELSESLRAAIEKLAASKQQQAEASEKSIEDDSPKRARSSGCSIFCRRRLLIEPEVYASAQKWLPEAVKTTNVTAAERMVKKAVNIGDAVNVGNNI